MADNESPPPVIEDPPPTPSRRAQSRLPVPKKVSALPVPAPTQPSSALRSQASRERLRTVVPGGKSPAPRTIPTIAKRPSVSGLASSASESGRKLGSYTDATASSSARNTIRTPSSNYGLNAVTNSPLTKKPSIGSMQSYGTASPRLAKMPSSPQLQQPKNSTPKRRTSDINGAAAPPLNRKASNSQLQSPMSRKPSTPQLARKASSSALNPPTDFSPTPLRRASSSSELPKPLRSPIVAKSPARPTQATPQPRKATRAPKAQPLGPASPPKAPGAHRVASQSLRDTIAKAKAAHRAASSSKPEGQDTDRASPSNDLNGFNFETVDPFNQSIFGEGGSTKVLQQRVKSARVEGRLNISNLQLKEIPNEVWKMYETTEEDLEADDDGPKWYESVDLVRLVGADNEIESLGEELATQFGGLATIDMHNNLLSNLPTNFGELTELTVLNLSNNKLDNGVLDVLFQITTLKDLKLAKNGLEGEFDAGISRLEQLENLELQDNRLTSLPDSLCDLSQLHSLNISRNSVANLPLAIWSCPLRELDASSNRLEGTLFGSTVEQLEKLETLDVRNNSLSSLAESPVILPSLKQMLVSNNQLISLPAMAGWDELVVILTDSNRLTSLPEDLYNMPRLRTLDFSGNDIKAIDPRLGTIESLETIRFTGNPLAEIRLAGMNTTDLKKTLLGRLAPPTIAVHEPEDSEPALPGLPGFEETPKGLEVGRGGALDLSSKKYSELPLELLETVDGTPDSIVLARNNLTAIPTSVEYFCVTIKTLDLSLNRLTPDSYLTEKLAMPALTTLNLHNTGINSLALLMKNLEAPRLDSLDASANRITSIEGIRQAFGQLTTLLMADNLVTEIPIESVDGLRVLDLSGNAIAHLPPKLALLEGLRELRVQGNLFRVPKWQILDKGTEAVMNWLRDRLPPEEGGEVVEPEPEVD